MNHITFFEADYQTKKRKTLREIFLDRMDKLIAWQQLEKAVARIALRAGMVGLPIRCLPCCVKAAS